MFNIGRTCKLRSLATHRSNHSVPQSFVKDHEQMNQTIADQIRGRLPGKLETDDMTHAGRMAGIRYLDRCRDIKVPATTHALKKCIRGAMLDYLCVVSALLESARFFKAHSRKVRYSMHFGRLAPELVDKGVLLKTSGWNFLGSEAPEAFQIEPRKGSKD